MGGPSCSVKGCEDGNRTSQRRKIYYSFPQSEAIRDVWVRATGIMGFQPNNRSYICDQHFDSCFINKKDNKKLYANAVPTCNLPSNTSGHVALDNSIEIIDDSTTVTISDNDDDEEDSPISHIIPNYKPVSANISGDTSVLAQMLTSEDSSAAKVSNKRPANVTNGKSKKLATKLTLKAISEVQRLKTKLSITERVVQKKNLKIKALSLAMSRLKRKHAEMAKQIKTKKSLDSSEDTQEDQE